MDEKPVTFGLIGFPLEHSWSPGWFTEKFRKSGEGEKQYRLFPLKSLNEFPDFLRQNPGLAGLNVTIPYKVSIIPYLDELDDTARSVGAVNTIQLRRINGVFHSKGFNTDANGFFLTLTDAVPKGPALILGTGGGARAVAHALNRKNIPFKFVSRNISRPGIVTYKDLTREVIGPHLFIINTTPLGMYPDFGGYPPIPYKFLTGDHCLYDLIYNPEETEFIKRGTSMKASTMNGLQMLFNQAELSCNIFLNKV